MLLFVNIIIICKYCIVHSGFHIIQVQLLYNLLHCTKFNIRWFPIGIFLHLLQYLIKFLHYNICGNSFQQNLCVLEEWKEGYSKIIHTRRVHISTIEDIWRFRSKTFVYNFWYHLFLKYCSISLLCKISSFSLKTYILSAILICNFGLFSVTFF